jgi:hypothetical protein
MSFLSESELLYDWRFIANLFVLAKSPLRLTTSNFLFQLNTYGHSSYVTSSLTRGRVCRLQLLLTLTSAVILRFKSRFYSLRFETPPTSEVLRWNCLLPCHFYSVRVRVTLRLTVSQSVCLGVEPHLGLMTRYWLCFESYSPVNWGRPLWREVGSVICHSQSLSPLSVFTYINKIMYKNFRNNFCTIFTRPLSV